MLIFITLSNPNLAILMVDYEAPALKFVILVKLTKTLVTILVDGVFNICERPISEIQVIDNWLSNSQLYSRDLLN